MLFSSMTFIFIFLPIVIALYFLMNPKFRNLILLAASVLFYAWGEPKYVAILLLTVFIDYFGAIIVDKEEKQTKKLILLWTVILLNLSVLIYFKYFNFLIDNINLLFRTHIDFIKVIMPIGISFYTFQALSYVVDVYRKEVKAQRNILDLALYIVMFPQLVAGPIVKYHDVEEQITNRTTDFNMIVTGSKRFICGLAKKVLIANTMGAIADKIFGLSVGEVTPLTAWLGGFAYSFQLFFDFSGYSDMAIGLGLIFGFKYLENFNFPYISKSISEFWRRWHISLSTWFKQYVYITLGGNRSGLFKTCRNLGIVFLLTGIWHGANWTFIVWGIWNGFFIIVERLIKTPPENCAFMNKFSQFFNNLASIEHYPAKFFVECSKHIYTILVFVIGWVIFRSDNLTYAVQYIQNMFGLIKTHDITYAMPFYIDNMEIAMFIIAIFMSMPFCRNLIYSENKVLRPIMNIWLLVLFVLSSASIAASNYNPFIYFRF